MADELLARLSGGPAAGRTIPVQDPPPRRYIWTESALLEPIPEGGDYPEDEHERYRYDLETYETDPEAPEPRAIYTYGGKMPNQNEDS